MRTIVVSAVNIRKGGTLVDRDYIAKIEERNQMLIEAPLSPNNKRIVENEFVGYYPGLLYRMWDYARMSGIR
jgi:hypothetical protein